ESRPEGISRLYIYSDQGSYEPLARVDKAGKEGPNRILYFHTDVNGAPEEMTDSDGKIVWETGYQVWGNTIQEKDHGRVEQNLRYQGQYLDRETGLHYNLHRYYDPDVGRFIVTDPIGLNGGINLYAYAPNPLSWIDPLGLFCGSSQKHHPIPKFLGGNKKQDLIKLDKAPHVDFHNALNESLKKLFGMRGGGKGGGTRDWEKMMQRTPGAQQRALDAALDAARKTDATHGTSIFDAIIDNMNKGNYKKIP
ncbi:RHS repeat-associated core domain-containing protein, partial [Escherichia marmotae]|nr:RHS repeat-associated core domain-containing protein [Escherichia marmotae]MED0190935.1 RHS repeat-associated core domain-containing protein [Escherichia marmotae]